MEWVRIVNNVGACYLFDEMSETAGNTRETVDNTSPITLA